MIASNAPCQSRVADHVATFPPAEDGSIVTGPSGRPARRADLSDAWRAAKARTGVDPELHIHDLRHHAATLMARMPGITTKELMARIGHASPRAALIHQPATAERDRAVATFLDEQLAAVERRPRADVYRSAAPGPIPPRSRRGVDPSGERWPR